jgi:hypothetical protein
MKRDEAFILHIKSLLNDCVNNHVGNLRCRAEEEDLPEKLKENFRSEANLLLKKQKRIVDEVIEYLGGEERFTELLTEDFNSGHRLSCHWNEEFKDEKESS